jgi:hypothetical protein
MLMAISLKALIDDRAKLASLRLDTQKCPYCDVVLQETITGKRPTPKGFACSDCYYEQLGEGVERHPIVTARVRRG